MIGERYNIGDRVIVIDQITYSSTRAIVKYVEQDNEISDLFWIYLVIDDDIFNDKLDINPNIGRYWEVIDSISPYLRLI